MKQWCFGFMLAAMSLVGASCNSGKTNIDSSSGNENVESLPAKVIQIAETGRTEYFEITVNKVVYRTFLRGAFTDGNAGEGNVFLLFNVTIKNIDNESRVPLEGSILINYNGKWYKYDSPEHLVDGFFMEPLNPLVRKTANIAYKIPAEIIGDIYWEPGRNPDNQFFYLGTKQLNSVEK